jgi:hypothetical protein
LHGNGQGSGQHEESGEKATEAVEIKQGIGGLFGGKKK